MEKINVQDTTIKRVVPIKGNILEKLKNHLHQKKSKQKNAYFLEITLTLIF